MDLIAKPLNEDERLFCNDSLTFVFFLSQEKHGFFFSICFELVTVRSAII